MAPKIGDLGHFLGGKRPESRKEEEIMEMRAKFYYLINRVLFRKTFLPTDAKCLSQPERILVLREAHEGGCVEHAGACSLARKVIRAGFYWPTLKKYAEEMVRKCDFSQKHGQKIHIPTISSPCPFARWGIDIIGSFIKEKGNKQFLVVAIDYFTKLVEAEPLSKISQDEMIHFIRKNIDCRLGLPRILVSDNGPRFKGDKIKAWCNEMKIEQIFTAVTHPQANGQVEVINGV